VIQTAPFSEVISLLSKDLGLASDQNLLLSHKTATLMPTESPLSRSLTTANIIGKVWERDGTYILKHPSMILADVFSHNCEVFLGCLIEGFMLEL